jgi:Methylmalonyl-CoA mutase, N-terminal domain/subunit
MSKEKPIEELPAVDFSEFDATTYEEWKEETILALKGADFNKSMFTKTYEGITLDPIYTLENTKELTYPHTLPSHDGCLRGINISGYIKEPWEISQLSDAALLEDVNQILKRELLKGTRSLHVKLHQISLEGLSETSDSSAYDDRGVCVSSLADMEVLLNGIDITSSPFQIDTGESNKSILGLLAAYCQEHNIDTQRISGCIGADPIGALALRGHLTKGIDPCYDELAHGIFWTKEKMPRIKSIFIRSDVYHDGGANALEEIAYAMSSGIEYIKALKVRGLSISDIAPRIRFCFSLGSNFFMEIAKIRAARIIWAQIVKEFGGSDEEGKADIYARTSYFTKTIYDPYVNMLRTTTEAFSGAVAGVNEMMVAPFDEPIRSSDEFSRRISRNTQIMMQEEFNLLQPIDPAGGSWYLETLTDQVARQSWEIMQKLEAQGGILKALKVGMIQEKVEEVLEKRFKNLATRADRAVGTNMYANVTEELLDTRVADGKALSEARQKRVKAAKASRSEEKVQEALDNLNSNTLALGELIPLIAKAYVVGALQSEICQSDLLKDSALKVRAIAPRRWTEQFEEMRLRTEKFVKSTGKNVRIFLANMGPIPQHKARADFITGFMEVANFELIKNDGHPSIEECAKSAIESEADIVVICSTDATYPELVPPLAKLIKAGAPKMKVFLAGAPAADMKDAYLESGVEEFINVRSNCYQVLVDLQKAKGMFE